MKNTISNIKSIKIGEQLGTNIVLGVKIILKNFRP